MPLFRWNSYTFLKKCINWTVLSLSHMHSHIPSPAPAAAPGPGEGDGRGMKPQNETPRLHLALYCLRLSGTDLEQNRCWVWLQHQELRTQQTARKKKNPQKEEKTVLICNCKTDLHGAELRSDPGLQQGDWAAASWKMCWGNERNLCFGAASNLKPGIVLCIQPTHSETFAPPCGASGTRWIPARNLLSPLNNEFFWGKPVQNKQRGILSETLHTFSICPQHLQETAGGVLYSRSFKKINLLLTCCLPESTLLLPVSPAHPQPLQGAGVWGSHRLGGMGRQSLGKGGSPVPGSSCKALGTSGSSAWALLCSCPISLSASKP